MARSHWLKAAALLGCLFIAVPGCKKENAATPGAAGGAGGNNSTSIDQSTPKAAAKSMAMALKNDDIAGVKAVVTGTPDQMKKVDLVAPAFAAMMKLSNAANAKFGAGNVISKDTPDMVAEMDKADEKIDGDSATLTPKDLKPGQKPTQLTKKDGKWFVDLKSVDEFSETMAKSITKVANETAADIAAGKFASADAANAELEKRMTAAMTGGAGLPGTLPAVPH